MRASWQLYTAVVLALVVLGTLGTASASDAEMDVDMDLNAVWNAAAASGARVRDLPAALQRSVLHSHSAVNAMAYDMMVSLVDAESDEPHRFRTVTVPDERWFSPMPDNRMEQQWAGYLSNEFDRARFRAVKAGLVEIMISGMYCIASYSYHLI